MVTTSAIREMYGSPRDFDELSSVLDVPRQYDYVMFKNYESRAVELYPSLATMPEIGMCRNGRKFSCARAVVVPTGQRVPTRKITENSGRVRYVLNCEPKPGAVDFRSSGLCEAHKLIITGEAVADGNNEIAKSILAAIRGAMKKCWHRYAHGVWIGKHAAELVELGWVCKEDIQTPWVRPIVKKAPRTRE